MKLTVNRLEKIILEETKKELLARALREQEAGIQAPSGEIMTTPTECPDGYVAAGAKTDGTLKCKKAPPDDATKPAPVRPARKPEKKLRPPNTRKWDPCMIREWKKCGRPNKPIGYTLEEFEQTDFYRCMAAAMKKCKKPSPETRNWRGVKNAKEMEAYCKTKRKRALSRSEKTGKRLKRSAWKYEQPWRLIGDFKMQYPYGKCKGQKIPGRRLGGEGYDWVPTRPEREKLEKWQKNLPKHMKTHKKRMGRTGQFGGGDVITWPWEE